MVTGLLGLLAYAWRRHGTYRRHLSHYSHQSHPWASGRKDSYPYHPGFLTLNNRGKVLAQQKNRRVLARERDGFEYKLPADCDWMRRCEKGEGLACFCTAVKLTPAHA